jgi:hypothetical protein
MNDLAKKCNLFLTWMSDTRSPVLAEHLWTTNMLKQAAEMFPELNQSELQRLVSRDWRYMGEEERAVQISICRTSARSMGRPRISTSWNA